MTFISIVIDALIFQILFIFLYILGGSQMIFFVLFYFWFQFFLYNSSSSSSSNSQNNFWEVIFVDLCYWKTAKAARCWNFRWGGSLSIWNLGSKPTPRQADAHSIITWKHVMYRDISRCSCHKYIFLKREMKVVWVS